MQRYSDKIEILKRSSIKNIAKTQDTSFKKLSLIFGKLGLGFFL
jgi:hypothetical protein